ncbi:hypothetical protein B0H14DRAFT_3012961 [Mycena olivaceomarginata]|nr:hypothetical protein B0H14DRAFT_3012961 [Mycena olivaceomarginata]
MNQDFPQELIDAILDHLADDRRSLKACSLVCRAWVSRCRSHLFGNCSLFPNDILVFRDLLRAPHCTFAQDIRSMSVVRLSDNEYDHYFDEIAVDLRRLTTIRELRLYLSSQYTVPSEARTFFCAGLFTAFPNVTCLILSFEFVLDMICLFPALRELQIHRSGLFLDSDSIPSTPPPRGLRSLEITGNAIGPMLVWLNRSNQLLNIDTLTLSPPHAAHIPTVRIALQQLGGALLHLSIDMARLPDPSTVFDLKMHPNLKTLTVRDAIPLRPPDNFDPNQFIRLIKRLAAPDLERLSLILELRLYESLDWAALDQFLSTDRFPRMRSVVVVASADPDKEFVRQALPLLGRSGILQLD